MTKPTRSKTLPFLLIVILWRRLNRSKLILKTSVSLSQPTLISAKWEAGAAPAAVPAAPAVHSILFWFEQKYDLRVVEQNQFEHSKGRPFLRKAFPPF